MEYSVFNLCAKLFRWSRRRRRNIIRKQKFKLK
jgi:hypothetical protein